MQAGQEAVAYAWDSEEIFGAAEGAVAAAVGQDPPGQRGADSGQGGQLSGVGAVGVHPEPEGRDELGVHAAEPARRGIFRYETVARVQGAGPVASEARAPDAGPAEARGGAAIQTDQGRVWGPHLDPARARGGRWAGIRSVVRGL